MAWSKEMERGRSECETCDGCFICGHSKFIGLRSLFNRCMNEEGKSGCFVTERAKWSSN